MESYVTVFLIAIITIALTAGVLLLVVEKDHYGEAKHKSYHLIMYLDDAFEPNNLHSFKVVVYDSQGKKIISDIVTPDFNDPHQKISPRSGYKITDKAKQHPLQIQACAQQEYFLYENKKTHDDCFDITQNKAKTAWYSVFNYSLIEGFEGDDVD